MTAPLGPTPAVTVAICAHNAVGRLGPVLDSLAAQLPAVDPFEVVVVDNASTDGTGSFVENHPAVATLRAAGVPVRVVPEPRAGLMQARYRAGVSAAADTVAFLDDDTVAAPGYVAAGVAAMRDRSVGMLTSRVYADYEVPPSPAIARRPHLHAINASLGDQPITWTPDTPVAPTLGAGMWIRRDALVETLSSPEIVVHGRAGKKILQGDDIELGAHVARKGLLRRYVPALVLHHRIPVSRFGTRYLVRFIMATVRAEVLIYERYGQHRISRLRALWRFLVSVLALPVLLLRPDGWREAIFVLAARLAVLLGPQPVAQTAVRAVTAPDAGDPMRAAAASMSRVGRDA